MKLIVSLLLYPYGQAHHLCTIRQFVKQWNSCKIVYSTVKRKILTETFNVWNLPTFCLNPRRTTLMFSIFAAVIQNPTFSTQTSAAYTGWVDTLILLPVALIPHSYDVMLLCCLYVTNTGEKKVFSVNNILHTIPNKAAFQRCQQACICIHSTNGSVKWEYGSAPFIF